MNNIKTIHDTFLTIIGAFNLRYVNMAERFTGPKDLLGLEQVY